MSTTHIIQTVIEIVIIPLIIIGIIYEPIIAEWEEKQKEKVLRAFKNRGKYRR